MAMNRIGLPATGQQGILPNSHEIYEMTWLHGLMLVIGGLVGLFGYWLPYFVDRGFV